ncbi:hypothetical protein O3P69_004545 [Scylla paramamosain]|uniref:Uncharacterized protein n=1 Tax=Scylla paramamosain TaxID=85552 RepID=A0AAW0UHY8_SCYPA
MMACNPIAPGDDKVCLQNVPLKESLEYSSLVTPNWYAVCKVVQDAYVTVMEHLYPILN